MYTNDEITNKSSNLPSLPSEITCPQPLRLINPSQYHISSNANKFFPNNLHSYNYEPIQDLTTRSPTQHASSSSNDTSINPMLCTTNQELITDNIEDELELRKFKRKMSNRDSARKSRLRKRKQLESLQVQVYHLLSANHQLADKIKQVMESNYQILQENEQLRDLISSMKGGLEEGGECNHNGFLIRDSQTITSASITSTSKFHGWFM